MIIKKFDKINIETGVGLDAAVLIAAENLKKDFLNVLSVRFDSEDPVINIKITAYDKNLLWEAYVIKCSGNNIYITGADRRGSIYGIYKISEMLGVSPWYFMADVYVRAKESIEFPDDLFISEHPGVKYRGIFINDEEELDNWVRLHMGEDTIGVKTYEKIFEMLLRLRLNYIWPAMHVNSFNMKKENGILADKMGIVVGTSHCDMLMRSNNREWAPWCVMKGYTDAEYDYSAPGRNREILNEYWSESVDQNKDLEVSYTLGMRGVHDSGFNVKNFALLKDKELLDAKIGLLETVISAQEKIIEEKVPHETLKLFIPYKEVLELYDNGLKVPDDLTLIWVNDNYGYVRRYPSKEEKKRAGGNGIYYHNSYWAPPGNSYMFINTIPLSQTKNELIKAYNEGITKLWVTNFGTIKPFEEELSYYADLAWETGNGNESTEDVASWLKTWLTKTFGSVKGTVKTLGESRENDVNSSCEGVGDILAADLIKFDQVTNVRKVEHLDFDIFPLYGYGDEGGKRINFYRTLYEKAVKIWENLEVDRKDAFFQMILMKIQAAYFSNAMFYYADRAYSAEKAGNHASATYNTVLSLEYDKMRRKMLYYYNNVMSDGKWSGILTPEDFPPPRTAMYPAVMPALCSSTDKLIVRTWSDDGKLRFTGKTKKWIEISNAGESEIGFNIYAPDFLKVSESSGTVHFEKRIFIENLSEESTDALILIDSPDTGEEIKVNVCVNKGADDGRIILEHDLIKEVTGNVSFIKHLGRDHGDLLQFDDETGSVSYEFFVCEDGEYKILIHRFPTLNSVGYIRVKANVDGEEMILSALATDEHIANWKENVQNNGEIDFGFTVFLKKGSHKLELKAIDKYFSYSRIFVVRKDAALFNTGTLNYGEDLPFIPDFNAEALKMYGEITLSPRREIFTTFKNYSNVNVDYDEYREGAQEVDLKCFKREFEKHVKETFESAKCMLTTDFAAGLVFADTEYAYVSQKIDYCLTPENGGIGLGAYVREKNKHYTDNAPVLNFTFEIKEKSKYMLWLELFMWGKDRMNFEVTIDGETWDLPHFIKKLWSYSSENAWKQYPVCEKELDIGVHKLSIKILDSGLRIGRIHFGTGDIWKN